MFTEIPYDIYHYKCAICEKEVKTEHINTCLICHREICDTCLKEGFCIDHFNLLTFEGKSKLHEIIEDGKNKKKKLIIKQYFAYSICFIIFFFSLLLPIIFTIPYSFTFLWVLFFISSFILFPLLLSKFDGKRNKLYIKLQKDKITLYKRYNKGKEIQIPKIKKKCEKCGRILKSDSNYCDICGFKLNHYSQSI
ncbi:MAG: hypothetical protein ACFFHV_17760 [Promethearchaeota archaeon]